ncbi:uncharacterized protein LOC121415000 [Lytechinus variegatus]|uniref:uncharacterized protein LOC121415000 n=1 Tax=Lytechinus variegatus TaxID=7654 RepID=UPI001BB2CE11|nr:uncharacterized protein LOC121415000 [Lytechinus variegatus]
MKNSTSSVCLIFWLSIACCVMWTINAQTSSSQTTDSAVTFDVEVTTSADAPEQTEESGAESEHEGTPSPSPVPEPAPGSGNETTVTEKPKSGSVIKTASITLLTMAILATKLV